MTKREIVVRLSIACLAALWLTGCATATHGNFVPATHVEPEGTQAGDYLGKVVGESSQTWALYLFPVGEPPSTIEAIEDAKSRFAGTRYLTDMAIDNRFIVKFGYSLRVIKVEANAYR